jgi:putative methyltransferase (TIGR04325 family)
MPWIIPEDFDAMPSTAICVFAFKRPDHLRACLSALIQNKEAKHLDLRLYVDAPRQAADIEPHRQVLNVCAYPWPFASIQIFKAKINRGLFDSLVAGISETLQHYESVIVVEDDIRSSPFFIRYLLDGLRLYEDSKEVASIHGYTPPISQQLPETFFLRGADCWGWATWRNRWELFRHDAAAMAEEIRRRGLVNEFNLNGSYDYIGMLDARAKGRNNSWAICWHASCFLANRLTLYPGTSLVENIGLDGSGEHCMPSKLMAAQASQSPIRVEKIHSVVNPSVYFRYCSHFSSDRTESPSLKKIISKIMGRLLRVSKKKNYSGLTLLGPFDSLGKAEQQSTGYNSNVILNKVRDAVVDLLEGNAAYERDGTAFAMRPSINHLRRILKAHLKGSDVVVDFGGGLGGAFINNRDLYKHSNRYVVVEQSIFAEAGSELSQKYGLQIQFIDNFFHLPVKPDIIILSAVLQYIPYAEQVLQQTADFMPRLIIIDRTAMAPDNDSPKWWVQHEPTYYQAPVSYPNRPLSLDMMLSRLRQYSVIEEWKNPFDPVAPPHAGFLLCRRD